DNVWLSGAFLDWTGLPVAALGPQPFAGRDGKCCYVYRTEIRALGDDALVACAAPVGERLLPRAVQLAGGEVLAVSVQLASRAPERKLAWDCELVRLRGDAQLEAFCPGQGQVTELSCSPPTGPVVLALETAERD